MTTAQAEPAAGAAETGERQRVVWFAHLARASAALVVLYARFIFEFQEQRSETRGQDGLVPGVTYHDPISVPTSILYTLYEWPKEHLEVDLGAAAVGMFFMLSGFVIPFALERRTLPAFGIRRILRVYPTLIAATALSILAVWITTRRSEFPFDRDQIVSSGTLVAQYSGNLWIDPSYWTIPIEELFYVTAALLAFGGLLRRPAVIVVTVLAVGGLGVALGRVLPPTDQLPDWTFWTRFWLGRNLSFMTFIWVGVALHMLYRGFWTPRTFAVVAAVVIGVFYLALHHGPFQHPFLPGGNQAGEYFRSFVAGFGIFMLLYLLGDRRLPKNRPIEIMGDMSYPVYLTITVIGWTVLIWITNWFDSYFLALPVATAIVLTIAYVLHRAVEAPVYAFAQSITRRRVFRSGRSWSDPPRRLARTQAEASYPAEEMPVGAAARERSR